MSERIEIPEQMSETKWLAILIRQGLLLIVKGIEARYGLGKAR